MRALPLEFSSDQAAGSVGPVMCGPAFPVVTERARNGRFISPLGALVDFWTGKRLRGGQIITAQSPPDKIPVYAKAGSVMIGYPAPLRSE